MTSSSASEAKRSNSNPSDAQKGEFFPDGDDVLSEWKEGSRTVIEKRSGPGEEPEVQVVDNGDRDTIEGVVNDTVHGGPHSIGKELHKSFAKVSEEAERGAEKISHTLKGRGE